jgi:predicted nuclease of predicted toxin-antitoxin system
VRFLVDAQLPRRHAVWLAGAGHDAIHTLDLPHANRTLDDAICGVADAENRIVVTKDDDFVYSFLVQGRPAGLLLIGTGNISNTELLALFQERLPALVESFVNCHFVELTRECILLHDSSF